MSSMNNCLWYRNYLGCAVKEAACPYDCDCDAIECSAFVYDDKTKTSSLDKIAAWEDVAAKAHAIVDTGGVEIVEDSAEQIRAYVMSGQLEGRFPVTDGGPYEVILSKKSWGNSPNVGGWCQGYLCDCDWGYYHSGEPGDGGRFSGRFCSHSYAALLYSNMRARKDFMGDRKAASMDKTAYEPAFDRGWMEVPDTKTWMHDYHGTDAFATIAPPNTQYNPDSNTYILRFQLRNDGHFEEYYGDSLEELQQLADEMNNELMMGVISKNAQLSSWTSSGDAYAAWDQEDNIYNVYLSNGQWWADITDMNGHQISLEPFESEADAKEFCLMFSDNPANIVSASGKFDSFGVELSVGDYLEFDGDVYELKAEDELGFDACDVNNLEWGDTFIDKYDCEDGMKIGGFEEWTSSAITGGHVKEYADGCSAEVVVSDASAYRWSFYSQRNDVIARGTSYDLESAKNACDFEHEQYILSDGVSVFAANSPADFKFYEWEEYNGGEYWELQVSDMDMGYVALSLIVTPEDGGFYAEVYNNVDGYTASDKFCYSLDEAKKWCEDEANALINEQAPIAKNAAAFDSYTTNEYGTSVFFIDDIYGLEIGIEPMDGGFYWIAYEKEPYGRPEFAAGKADSLEQAKADAIAAARDYYENLPLGYTSDGIPFNTPQEERMLTSSKKVATRQFTYAEMQELDAEIEGRELHNRSRLKAFKEEALW